MFNKSSSALIERVLTFAPWVVLGLLVATVTIQARWLKDVGRPLVGVLGVASPGGDAPKATLVLVMQPRDCAIALTALDPIASGVSTAARIEAIFVDNALSAEQAAAVASAGGIDAPTHVINQRDAVFVMNALSIRATPFAVLIDSAGRIRRVFVPPGIVSAEEVRQSL